MQFTLQPTQLCLITAIILDDDDDDGELGGRVREVG